MLVKGLKEIPLLDGKILRKGITMDVENHIAKGLIKTGYAEKVSVTEKVTKAKTAKAKKGDEKVEK